MIGTVRFEWRQGSRIARTVPIAEPTGVGYRRVVSLDPETGVAVGVVLAEHVVASIALEVIRDAAVPHVEAIELAREILERHEDAPLTAALIVTMARTAAGEARRRARLAE